VQNTEILKSIVKFQINVRTAPAPVVQLVKPGGPADRSWEFSVSPGLPAWPAWPGRRECWGAPWLRPRLRMRPRLAA